MFFNENIGVARSWNIGVEKVIDEKLDYLIILSASIRFKNGMDDLISELDKGYNYGLETQHGWHLICLSRKTLESVGYFDENFYPAYWEDSDYIRRMEIIGIHDPMNAEKQIPKFQVGATCVTDAHALKTGVKVNFVGCQDYFVEKWGATNEFGSQLDRDKMYKTPFNNPENPIDYFPKRTIKALKEKYNL